MYNLGTQNSAACSIEIIKLITIQQHSLTSSLDFMHMKNKRNIIAFRLLFIAIKSIKMVFEMHLYCVYHYYYIQQMSTLSTSRHI